MSASGIADAIVGKMETKKEKMKIQNCQKQRFSITINHQDSSFISRDWWLVS